MRIFKTKWFAREASSHGISDDELYQAIQSALQGKVVDLCFTFLSDGTQPIAIRVFAMTVLTNIAKENPELKNEIIPLIEDQMPFGSAGFRSRGRKVLQELKS